MEEPSSEAAVQDDSGGGKETEMQDHGPYQKWLERALSVVIGILMTVVGGWATVVKGTVTRLELDRFQDSVSREIDRVDQQIDRWRDFAEEQRVFNEKVLGRVEAKELIWASRLNQIEAKQEMLPALVVEQMRKDRMSASVRETAGP